MTPQERETAFLDALRAATQRYGVDLVADARHEKHGIQVQVTPLIRTKLLENWTAPETERDSEPERENGATEPAVNGG